MKAKYIIVSLLLAIGLSSCVVSKKKYDTLNMAKQYADRKVRNLIKEKAQLEEHLDNRNTQIASLKGNLRTLKEEFNNLKYDMSASNAQKSTEIDKLTKKLNSSLKDKEQISEKTQELEGDLNWLRKQRQMNTEKIDTLTTTIRGLEREVETLKSGKNTSDDALQIAQKKIENLTSKVNATQELLDRTKAQNIKLQKQLANQPKQAVKESVPEI